MRADPDDVCESACAAHGETRPRPLKAFPPPPAPKTVPHFEALYLSSGSLRHRVVNNLLGWDARKAVTVSRTALSALRLTKKKLQETTNQEPFHSDKYDRNSAAHYWSSTTHSLHVSSNEQEQCERRACVALRSRRLFPWIGGKLQQKPVQIRRDGFVMCLKCQLLREAIRGLRSWSDGLNFQLFPSNCCDHKTIIAKCAGSMPTGEPIGRQSAMCC